MTEHTFILGTLRNCIDLIFQLQGPGTQHASPHCVIIIMYYSQKVMQLFYLLLYHSTLIPLLGLLRLVTINGCNICKTPETP